MSRVKPFIVQVDVSEEFLRQTPDPRSYVREALRRAANDLTGPRGGRYEPVNQPFDFREGPPDFLTNTRPFSARVTGRYVRPSRDTDGG